MYVRPLLPALLVFLALLVIIGVSWRTAKQDIVVQQRDAVSENASFVESSLRQRFNIYEDGLRAAAGLYASSDFVTRDEWLGFVKSLQLETRYPGIRGLGYIARVPVGEKETIETTARAEGLTNFVIHPTTSQSTIAPLLYMVPLGDTQYNDRNTPLLGFDMYSVPERAETMQTAAQTGQPTLSRIMDLVPATGSSPSTRGFLLFMPLYQEGMPLDAKDQRLAAIRGYFYAPFVTGSAFTSLFTVRDPSFGFAIYDHAPSADTLLYETPHSVHNNLYKEAARNVVALYGQDWTIVYKVKKEIVPYSVRMRPWNLLIGGGIFSFVLASVIYLLIQRRTRALAYNEQKKLESAKDELLSLASHQLRTPATAVKQYVSMVRDGFAGVITAEQRKLLQFAYESNERQLNIVDDLLYVARIDAGKASLRIEPINMVELMNSIINDQRSSLKEKKQTISLRRSQKNIMIEGDAQYLRMVLENILSNASKYSYEHSKILVHIQDDGDSIRVSVADKGVGIDPVDFSEVFKKFSRIPNALTRQTAGSGIGLYLAKQLTMLHGGDITFSSHPKKGTTFVVTLPKQQPADRKV